MPASVFSGQTVGRIAIRDRLGELVAAEFDRAQSYCKAQKCNFMKESQVLVRCDWPVQSVPAIYQNSLRVIAEEIAMMNSAFSQLPDSFYHLPDFKGLYRRDHFRGSEKGSEIGGIPAATFPKFRSIFRNSLKSYVVEVDDDEMRIEFYNPLFLENREDLINRMFAYQEELQVNLTII